MVVILTIIEIVLSLTYYLTVLKRGMFKILVNFYFSIFIGFFIVYNALVMQFSMTNKNVSVSRRVKLCYVNKARVLFGFFFYIQFGTIYW